MHRVNETNKNTDSFKNTAPYTSRTSRWVKRSGVGKSCGSAIFIEWKINITNSEEFKVHT